MHSIPVLRFGLVASAWFLFFGAPLLGQNIVIAEYKGKIYPVLAAHRQYPEVEVAGKRVDADERRLGLKKADEYLPVFVSVHRPGVYAPLLYIGGNTDLRTSARYESFSAYFETPYKLSNVFLVLEWNHDSKEGKQMFLYEVGNLEPRIVKFLNLNVPVGFSFNKGKYRLHLFSNGSEVLHSKIPKERRDAAMKRMIAKRIRGVQEAEPKAFIGPTPDYPTSLFKAKTKGQAIITMTILANGQVIDPVVTSATEPAIGASALEAVKEWWFLPKVEKGRAVESQFTMPFDSGPPSKSQD